MPETDTKVDDEESAWDRERRQDLEMRREALALETRKVDLAERQIEEGAKFVHSANVEEVATGISAFFLLPAEQKDFRLREAAAGLACRAAAGNGARGETLVRSAERLFEWIKGEAW